MAKNSREQLLLGVFVALLVIVGGFMVGTIYFRKKTELEDEHRLLQLRLWDMEDLLAESDQWESRETWLRANQPRFPGEKKAEAAIYETADAKTHSEIDTWDVQYILTEAGDELKPAGVTFKVKGLPEEVFGWMYELQSPENFYAIERLTVQPDREDPTLVVCEVQLVRWYAPEEAG